MKFLLSPFSESPSCSLHRLLLPQVTLGRRYPAFVKLPKRKIVEANEPRTVY